MSLDSPLVRRARELAREAHAGQVRKSGNVAYFVHLESVAHLLAEHGYDDEIILATAFLHDLLEDQPAFADRLRKEQPPEVVAAVEALTETKRDANGALRDKRARFEDYARGLSVRTDATVRALPVSCADKIDNARSILGDQAPEKLLLAFRTRPGEHLPQLATLRALYADGVRPELLATFDATALALDETILRFLPARAVHLAAQAHLGQFDKAGVPYIYHPLRLMMRAESAEEKMVAVLHDVVEDTEWTFDALRREGFPRRVIRALEHLTRAREESYEEFIERIAHDRLASRVKLLDLEDNSDPTRIAQPTDEDRARVAKYHRAITRLQEELARRSLYVVLDDESLRAVRARAIHREVRGDHVTLAHRAARFDPAFVPGARALGDHIELRAVAEAKDERVQALVVEIDGSSRRPIDDGTLHVTVSFAADASAGEANDLLRRVPETHPIALDLRGTIAWCED